MNKLISKASLVVKTIGMVVTEYPAATAFGFFFVLVQLIAGGGQILSVWVIALNISMIIGIATNVLLPVISYRFKLKEIWNLAFSGIGIAIPFASFLLIYLSYGSAAYSINVVRLAVVSIVELVAAVYILIYKRDSGQSNKIARIFTKNFIMGVICGGVVYAIVCIPILLAGLAGLKFAFNPYARSVVFGVYMVFLFMLNAVSESTERRHSEYSDILEFTNRTVAYIIIPLMGIWYMINFIWLIRGMWWNNWADASTVFFRIFPMFVMGYITLLLTRSMKERTIFRIYRTGFIVSSLPIIALGSWRLVLLIMAYGVTEYRYFAILGYLLLIICELCLIFNIKKSAQPMLIAIALLSVISVLPVLNYSHIAAFSQVKRAESIMVRNNMLAGNEIVAPESISEDDRIELSRALEYLCLRGKEDMAEWLPLNFDFKNDYAEVFGVFGEYDADGNSTVASQVMVGELSSQYYNISEYDIALVNYVSYNLYNFSMDNILGKNGTYTVKLTDYAEENITVATVTRNGITVLEQEITDELGDIARFLQQNANSNNDTVYMPMGLMSIHLESDEVELLVVLKSVTMAKSENDSNRLTTALTDAILLKEN